VSEKSPGHVILIRIFVIHLLKKESGFLNQDLKDPIVSNSKIRALIELLGDDEARISRIAKQQLQMIGKDAIAFLDKASHTNGDGKIRIEARGLLQKITEDDLLQSFHLLAVWDDRQIDLEHGAYLLAKFAYPKLKIEKMTLELDRLANRIAGLIDGIHKPRRIVQMINNVLFTEARFEGNRHNYYSPDNSFLNKVLEKRTGIPISLALVYILIAQRLNLPIYGVNLPAHFLCKYETGKEPFYIDAFDFGRVLNESECVMLLKNYGVDFNIRYLKRANNREILSRMLRNLILVYYQNEEDEKAEFLKKLLKIVKHYSKKAEF
jgi:regulator of sirC expression with transglutaminase-like and TPR domain